MGTRLPPTPIPPTRTLRGRGHLARVAGGALLVAAAVAAPRTVAAQTVSLAQATATPEAAAELYLGSVRAIRWSNVSRVLAAPTLERFHELVIMLAATDSTGEVRRFLTDTDSAGFEELTPPEVFARAVGAMIDDMPGLMHALYDRDDEVLGHVAEGADTAHVVYRTTARISGAQPEVKILQLLRERNGWRVLWSDDLAVLDTALRGVPRGRR